MITRKLFIFLLIASTTTFAQKPLDKVDVNRFFKDVAVSYNTGDHLSMSLWMPTVYWTLATRTVPDITPEVLEEIERKVDGYIILCVVNGKLIPNEARYETTPESVLRKKTAVHVNGKTLKPLYYNELTEDAQQVKDMVEPIFRQMLGDFGDGITILFFDATDEKGNKWIDPYGQTDFTVTIDDVTLTYNLPMPALFEDKICPEDRASFPANYSYCPFHGTLLKEHEEH